MTLWQILSLCWAEVSGRAVEHPVKAVLVCIGIVVGSSVTAQRLELPIWRWARDRINARLDRLGRRLNASLTTTVEEQGEKIATLETAVARLMDAQKKAEATADRRRADDYRKEILRFNLDLIEGRSPDRESFAEILRTIGRYEDYYREHKNYTNHQAEAAIRNILKRYDNRQKVGFNQEV